MTDIPIPADSDLSDAEAEELMLLCGHAPGPEPLSPAAQAVLDAASDHWPGGSNHPSKRACIAAALRAAADHVPDHQMSAHMLYAIADELEGQQ